MQIRFVALAAIVATIAAGSIHADNVTYAIDAHIIASGSSGQSVSSCFHMSAVVGEPVAGFSSSTDYTLNSGFFAVAPPSCDDIFFSGFEDCTP